MIRHVLALLFALAGAALLFRSHPLQMNDIYAAVILIGVAGVLFDPTQVWGLIARAADKVFGPK
jgi:membrane-bound metal-dependent hydrolase YbcI (DUF457 family)